VSYFSPAWYKTFGRVTNRSADWDKVIDAGFDLLTKCNQFNDGTGLTPQWTDCECSSSPNIGKHVSDFWCDATRVSLRMGISAAWHCDSRSLHQSEMLAAFFSKQGAATMQNGYTIKGEPLLTTDTDNACTESCFVTTAAATLVAGSSDTSFRDSFWNVSAQTPSASQTCYFCEALRLISLLFTSGLMMEPFAGSALERMLV